MEHAMRLKEKPFRQIQQGMKTIELRLNDEKRQRLNVGDTIVFSNAEHPSEEIKARVIALHVFQSFEELYKKLPMEKCGYSEKPKDAKAEDMEEYYSKAEQKLYGVLGIELELI